MTTIDDKREIKEFKTMSFSGYKRTEVKKEFISSLTNGRIEPASYCSAELMCSGHYSDI